MKYLLKQIIRRFSGFIALALLIGIGTLLTGDFAGFFQNIIRFLWLIIPLVVIVILIPILPSIKGSIGEKRVRKYLNMLDHEKYKVINNVFLHLKDERTAQIDHIVIAESGIFVIETKNFAGWIYGSEKAEYWTQKIYQSTRKFKNPLRQNYGHIKALQEVLEIVSDSAFHSIVVFTGSAELKKIDVSNVLKLRQLLPFIEAMKDIALNLDQVVLIEHELANKNPANRKEMKQHIAKIQDKKASSGKICPKCGKELVQRNGKYGTFMGCAGFPKCRYVYKGI